MYFMLYENTDIYQGLSWSWSYGSWIYNYLCNQHLSPIMLWVRSPPRWVVLNTTLLDKVSQWLVAWLWFSLSTLVFSTNINKTDRHNITEILLKVALNTITQPLSPDSIHLFNVPVYISWYTCIYYPLANEVAKGYSNATFRPSVTSLWTL